MRVLTWEWFFSTDFRQFQEYGNLTGLDVSTTISIVR
jgi:hypothetical protein